MKIEIILLVATLFTACKSKQAPRVTPTSTDSSTKGYETKLEELEKASIDRAKDSLGELIATISFNVKTDNLTDFEDGLIHWASIEKPEQDLPKLVERDKVVIHDQQISILIDYPLTTAYKFNLDSKNGFTRGQLLKEISKNYYKLYDEEEASATVKTLPSDKRIIYNRNETNGKYGIWGHDIADLVLSEILVYRTKSGKILLMLNIES